MIPMERQLPGIGVGRFIKGVAFGFHSSLPHSKINKADVDGVEEAQVQ